MSLGNISPTLSPVFVTMVYVCEWMSGGWWRSVTMFLSAVATGVVHEMCVNVERINNGSHVKHLGCLEKHFIIAIHYYCGRATLVPRSYQASPSIGMCIVIAERATTQSKTVLLPGGCTKAWKTQHFKDWWWNSSSVSSNDERHVLEKSYCLPTFFSKL